VTGVQTCALPILGLEYLTNFFRADSHSIFTRFFIISLFIDRFFSSFFIFCNLYLGLEQLKKILIIPRTLLFYGLHPFL